MEKSIGKLIFAIAAALSAMAAPSLAQEADPRDVSLRVEYLFRNEYRYLGYAKAIATNADGSFGYSWNQASDAEAMAKALEECKSAAPNFARKGKEPLPCFPLASGLKWLVEGGLSDDTWQKPARGADRPLRRGYSRLVPGGKSRGIILHIHGCDGLADKYLARVWADYFNALGFDFHAPSSFAEKRSKALCGKETDYPARDIFATHRLRIAQTLRSIDTLRKRHPEKPLYLWGHSEGGYIAQMIGSSLQGVIVTGEECGLSKQKVAAPLKVPFLFMLGENDANIDDMNLPLTPASSGQCVDRLAGHDWELVVLEKRGHIPWPWHDQAAKAVAAFLGAEWKPFEVKPGSSTQIPRRERKAFGNYQKQKNHRAYVRGPRGAWAWQAGWDNPDDAVAAALYDCSKELSPGLNVFKKGQPLCTLYDVNGARPTSP